MEKKTEKKYVDHGFGFPIYLHDVPMTKVRGTWTPDINYNDLTRAVAMALASNDAFLTGSQVKFIRQLFEMTLKEFGERFNVSHPAVIKWENQKNKSTKMDWSTEKDIRMEIVLRVVQSPKRIGDLFIGLEEKPSRASDSVNVELNVA
jgi:DNA-binding transcriptional regulator YiaG